MKVHKVELCILDHEGCDEKEIKILLEQNRYLSIRLQSIESREIGEWYDEHPLNHRDKAEAYYQELFKQGEVK